jgi:hypothetical protein
MLKIVELMKEVVSISVTAKKKDASLDFLEKPKKYDGSRAPHTIESWNQSIEDYGDLKDFDGVKKTKCGVTLLTEAAQI